MQNTFFTIVLVLTSVAISAQSIAVNTTGDDPAASAILDISSQNKGILIPRLTTAEREAIVNPATGLLVYDLTTRSFWVYTPGWQEIITSEDMGTAGGDLSGNYPTPVVVKLQGHNVDALTPADKQVLKWDQTSSLWKGMNDSLTLPFVASASDPQHVFSVTNSFNGFSNTTSIHGQRIDPSGIILPYSAAIYGDALVGAGVLGTSSLHPGIYGESLQNNGIEGYAHTTGKTGVFGYCSALQGNGVRGISEEDAGVMGITHKQYKGGVHGKSDASLHSVGVLGESASGDTTGIGVYGKSNSKSFDAGGVLGWNGKPGGVAVNGRCPFGIGLYGFNQTVDHPAIYGRNQSGGKAIYAYSSEYDGYEELTPMGVHGHVYTTAAIGYGILGTINGPGDGVRGYAGSGGSGIAGYDKEGVFAYAGRLETINPTSNYPTLFIRNGGIASSLFIDITNSAGTLPAFVVHKSGSSSDYAIFEDGNGVNKIRFDNTGKGFFNGGTQTGGADIAEVFDTENDAAMYEPGDVLVISQTQARTVTKSSTSYSALVAGVYATRPGVLLTEEHIDTDLSDKVPMGVLGVIPTKVCLEGGEINMGDMLVTSSIPGVAMKGDPQKTGIGQVLGKALDSYSGEGIGKINVLVSVR